MTSTTHTTYALHRITQMPLDFSEAIYQEYPLLKLGVSRAVAHYAKLLLPFTRQIMDNHPQYQDWVLTAPPYDGAPAAANLMCWEIHNALLSIIPAEQSVSVVNLYKDEPDREIKTAQDFSNYNDYSKYSAAERRQLKSKHRFVLRENDFKNKGIIFINDINVTGTGQEYIRQSFARFYPDSLHFVYIINCDRRIGEAHPQLENSINNFTIKTVEDFGRILSSEKMQYTAKCISKIFTYDLSDLETLLSMLDRKTVAVILDGIVSEKRYEGGYFKEKLDLVRSMV